MIIKSLFERSGIFLIQTFKVFKTLKVCFFREQPNFYFLKVWVSLSALSRRAGDATAIGSRRQVPFYLRLKRHFFHLYFNKIFPFSSKEKFHIPIFK
jgi:hypothetical protein